MWLESSLNHWWVSVGCLHKTWKKETKKSSVNIHLHINEWKAVNGQRKTSEIFQKAWRTLIHDHIYRNVGWLKTFGPPTILNIPYNSYRSCMVMKTHAMKFPVLIFCWCLRQMIVGTLVYFYTLCASGFDSSNLIYGCCDF